jgi:hypothetical protein
MTARIGTSLYGSLLLTLVLAGAWASWEEDSPRDAWALDDPVRSVTAFAPQDTLTVSYRLRNTARVPLRILGASIC